MNKTSLAQQNKITTVLSPGQGVLQRKCACGNKTVASGECTACAKKKNRLQRKLTIGASNDPLEREADRVADQVMAKSTNINIRKTLANTQRFVGQSTGHSEVAPPSVDRVLASSGKPMVPVLRQDMEQRFGHNFSQVRVHTGSTAEQSSRDVNAHAYTVGNNVVFAAGRFLPETNEGMRLLAHELTHVVQQEKAPRVHFVQREIDGADIIPASPMTCSMTAKRETIGTGFCINGTTSATNGTRVSFHYIPGMPSCNRGDLSIMPPFGTTSVTAGRFSWRAPTNVSSMIPGVGRLFGAIIGPAVCCTRSRPGRC